MNNGKTWLVPLTGILFVLILFAAFVVGGDPPDGTDKPVQEVIDFYVDNEDSVFTGSVLQALAAAVFLIFGGYLYKRLRASGAEGSAAVAFAGMIAFAVGVCIDGTINIASSELVNGDEAPAEGAIQALNALWQNDFLPFAMGIFVFLMGFGTAIIRHGVLPTWMGWVAVVAALTAISPAFPVAGIVAVLLIIASSVIFALDERNPQTT